MHEPLITIVGNVAQPPTLRVTASGVSVAGFRVAATPRLKNREKDEWFDGETLWFGVSAWRQLGEHCAGSIGKGDRVVVTGRLLAKTWAGTDGKERTSLEVEAATVGLELSRHGAKVDRSSPPVLTQDPGPMAGLVDAATNQEYQGPMSDEQLEEVQDAEVRAA